MTDAVSVLIVNYRSHGEIDACLAGLRTGSPPGEVVVVDHDSEPGLFVRLRDAHPEAVILPVAGNPGFGAGINRAARYSSGRLLLVLNPDTLVSPDAVADLAGWLDAHPETALVGPKVRTPDGAIEASARAFPSWSTVLGGRSTWLTHMWPGNPFSRRNILAGPDVEAPTRVDWVSGACMLVRRDAFEAVGGFDERYFLYWEDADLCRRLADAGWTVAYHPGCVVTHLGGRSSEHRPAASAVAFHRSAFRYFWKHGSPARRLLAPVVGLALVGRLAVMLVLGARARR